MSEEKPVPESLNDPMFEQLSDADLDEVAGGAEGLKTYERESTNGGTDTILVHTDNTDSE